MAHEVRKAQTVFKKAYKTSSWKDGCCIVVLRLSKGALTNYRLGTPYTYRKNRASAARVVRIEGVSGRVLKRQTAVSSYDSNFVFRVGKTVTPRKRFIRGSGECASGIHFFERRDSAEEYNL